MIIIEAKLQIPSTSSYITSSSSSQQNPEPLFEILHTPETARSITVKFLPLLNTYLRPFNIELQQRFQRIFKKYQNHMLLQYFQMQSMQEQAKIAQNSSPFIEKLQDILSDLSHAHIIRFNAEEKSVEITGKKKLEKILGKYFRHARYESFVRQLNWYGFYKANNQTLHCYKHPNLDNGLTISSIKSRRSPQSKKSKEQFISSPVLQMEPELVNPHRIQQNIVGSVIDFPQHNQQIPMASQIQFNNMFMMPLNTSENGWNMNNTGVIGISLILNPFITFSWASEKKVQNK